VSNALSSAWLSASRGRAETTVEGARIEVHVIALDLTVPEAGDAAGLSAEDLRRAARIRLADGRRAFLAAHRSLRAMLGARLGCAPEDVPITTTGIAGRPALTVPGPAFSLARRGDWCAIALSDDCAVGVDVEPIRPLPSTDLVAALLPTEGRDAVAAASPSDRDAVFLRWWTRVEAAVKACGMGLDDAHTCLARAPQRICEAVPGLAVAVAGLTMAPLLVDWRLAEGALAEAA
jgi:4'-phosphopantetheinyl transferase